jgi:hypothetical protein
LNAGTVKAALPYPLRDASANRRAKVVGNPRMGPAFDLPRRSD